MELKLPVAKLTSIRNTALSATDGSVQYHIETPFKWASRTTTTITKWTGPKREVVATIEWGYLYQLPTTTFREYPEFNGDREYTGNKFLKRISLLDITRTYNLTTPDGQSYVWHAFYTPELSRESDSKVVASYKHAQLKGDFKGSLMIEDELRENLDLVVTSFVIVEHFRRWGTR